MSTNVEQHTQPLMRRIYPKPKCQAIYTRIKNLRTDISGKIILYDNIERKIETIRKDNTIVFTNGCFDIIHTGHIKYIEETSKLGDILILGLNTDNSVKTNKGDFRPIVNEKDRAYILSSISFIDYIVLFDEKTPENLIKKIKPDFLVKGDDYRIEQIAGSEFVLNNGGQVITIPLIKEKSTTNIINKIIDNYSLNKKNVCNNK